MLVEKSVREALVDYAKGRKVVVLQFDAKGRIDANLLSDFFEDENNKYLVDVPAVVNPEFESAVQDMMKGSEVITPAEEDVNEEPAESEVEESESANDEDGEEKQLPPPTAPELEKEEVVPANNSKKKEYDPEVLRKYVIEGKSNKEIAELMGVSVGTIKNWVHENGLTGFRTRGGGRKEPQRGYGYNSDRHLCRSCRYRDGLATARGGCNYLAIVGHSRGCSVENCNVYEKGKKVTKKEAMRLREV